MSIGKHIVRLERAAREWRLYERGISSIAVFILAFPVFILAFGIGIDVIRLGYAKRIVQGRLDVAVQAAAAMTYTNPQGAVRLGNQGDGNSAASSLSEAARIYRENTEKARQAGVSQGNMLWCSSASVTQTNFSAGRITNTTTDCMGGPYVVLPGGALPTKDFNFCQPPKQGGYGVRYEVVEQVPTIFMRMVPGGPKYFTIKVSSEALLRLQYC